MFLSTKRILRCLYNPVRPCNISEKNLKRHTKRAAEREVAEYFVTSLIVYHIFFIVHLVALFSIPSTCCKGKHASKHKKKQRKEKKKSDSSSTTPEATASTAPIATTPTIPVPRSMDPPFLSAPKPTLTPTSAESAESAHNKPNPLLLSSNSKETAAKEEEKKSKKSEKEEDYAELLRCRDYTPELFSEFKWLFDLLD